jgi:hypothetical protein
MAHAERKKRLQQVLDSRLEECGRGLRVAGGFTVLSAEVN